MSLIPLGLKCFEQSVLNIGTFCRKAFRQQHFESITLFTTLQMSGGKGDTWIRGLLAKSVEKQRRKSRRVEDARTARQKEQERLARLRGEVMESGNLRNQDGCESGRRSLQVEISGQSSASLTGEVDGIVSGRGEDSESSILEQKEQEKLSNLGGSRDQSEHGKGSERKCQEEEEQSTSLNQMPEITKVSVAHREGGVDGKQLVDDEKTDASPPKKRKKLKHSKSEKKKRNSVNIQKEDGEEVVFIEVKEKKDHPIEVIDIEDQSDGEETLQPKKKKGKKKKEKGKIKKKRQEARFYKNPLFDAPDQTEYLSNGNTLDVDIDQRKGLLEGSETSVISLGTRFGTECESTQEASFMSEVNSILKFSSNSSSSSGVSNNGGESTSTQSSSKPGFTSRKKTLPNGSRPGPQSKKSFSAGGRKRRFTKEEDAVILRALHADGNEVASVSLAKELGRSQASLKSRLRKLQTGDLKKRHMAYALTEDLAIMDMVIPYVSQELEGRVPNWEWLRLAEENGQRRPCQSLRSRWEHHLRPWLLQHQAGTLNLSINSVLLSHLVSSYSSVDSIVWSEVAKMGEFIGHTESSLRGMFYSKLYKNAQRKGKVQLVTLKEIAEVEEARIKKERMTEAVKERQMEVIKYWSDKKKMNLVDKLLQEEKQNLLARKAGQRRVETLKEKQYQEELRGKKLSPLKEKQKKGGSPLKGRKKKSENKKQYESLPRLDHKHNKYSARLSDTYNLDEPILAQV